MWFLMDHGGAAEEIPAVHKQTSPALKEQACSIGADTYLHKET